MKLLLRVLWLLVGLIYRLIVLALFEHWIPFPERPPAEVPAPRAERKPRSAARAPAPRAPERRPQPAASGSRARPPIFEPRSAVEAAAERVVTLESEQLVLRARAAAPLQPPPATRSARPLPALLRDKRALASAFVLGEVFARRRPGPR